MALGLKKGFVFSSFSCMCTNSSLYSKTLFAKKLCLCYFTVRASLFVCSCQNAKYNLIPKKIHNSHRRLNLFSSNLLRLRYKLKIYYIWKYPLQSNSLCLKYISIRLHNKKLVLHFSQQLVHWLLKS